jgi:hypothetical protein
MASNDVKYVIVCEEGGAIRKFEDLDKALKHLEKQSKDTDKAARTFGQEFMRTLVPAFTAGQLAADGLRKVGQGLVGFFTTAASEAIESEKAQRRLATALEMTGRAHSGNLQTMLKFAESQSMVTLYTDEEIEATMTLLAQLTKLDTQGIQRATKGAMGLAAVMGVDLQSAATTVTRAMEGNFQALQRLGIVVDTTLPKHEQVAQVMARLEGLYGRATDETKGFGGALDMFTKSWKEFQEQLGKTLTESMNITRTLQIFTKDLQSLDHKAGVSKNIWQSLGSAWQGTTGIILGAVGAIEDTNTKTEVISKSMKAFLGDMRNAPGLFTDTADAVEQFTYKLINTDALVGKTTAHYAMMVQAMQEIQNLADFNDRTGAYDPRLSNEQPQGYKDWLEAQRQFAQDMLGQTREIYDQGSDYSDEFYQDITRGFVRAFDVFRLTTEGFKDFFIATWEAIKNAFFQILADMLAKWLTMAFVKLLLNLVAPGSFFGSGNAGSIGMQRGFHGVIQQPTLALIGESGPERVDVSPMRGSAGYGARTGGGGGSTQVNITIVTPEPDTFEDLVRHRIVPILEEVYAHGEL